MAKFRKKPVVIEAIKWDGNQLETPIPYWIKDALEKTPGVMGSIFRTGSEVQIVTLEGQMTARAGDWIIKGINHELYPCKPDIFEKTYEPV